MGNLIGLYLGGLIFSLALSVALWRQDRTQLNLDLCWVWVAGTASAVLQGALSQGTLPIVLGFSSTVLTNLALANLLARLGALSFPWRKYVTLYGCGVLASISLYFAEAPFWGVAAPIAVTATLPTISTGVRMLRKPDLQLGTTGLAFVFTAFAFVAHNLDFPFLRDRPEMAATGLTFAVCLVWALAPTGMAVVLERVALERGRIAELDALRTRFFANVSHELRTPLTLILGPIQRLLSAEDRPGPRHDLEVSQRNAQRLLRLIDDLLDLSRMEAGTLQLNVANLDMAEVVERVCELVSPAAVSKNIRMEVVPTDEPMAVFGDPHRLEIIVTNLLTNAVKYTPEGGHVLAKVEQRGPDVRVLVQDDGPGIAEEDQARIFERFVRAQNGGNLAAGGVGIGLALSRELAELHHGDLTVESSPGKGARFTLRLPRLANKPAQSAPHLASSLSSTPALSSADRLIHGTASATSSDDGARAGVDKRDPSGANDSRRRLAPPAPTIRLEGGRVPHVLVVDDEPDMRNFICEVVSEQFECTSVPDGEAAWELLQTLRPDLILTDLMMPKMTGAELSTRIKNEPSLSTIPVLLLTARSGDDTALESYASGADDFVVKPFHPHVLMARIRAHLTVRQLSLQLADQARLATAGSLAAGVAHEIRNPLNAILNAADVLEHLEGNVSPQELLAVVVQGVRRINTVVDALDRHVRPAEGAGPEPCDVRQGIEDTLRLLAQRSEHLTVQVQIPDAQEVVAPARAFHQALLNLVDNGLRAATSRLTIRVGVEGSMLRICIEDDGPGVPPDIRSRIFDPFFSTREVGEGAGLGLYLSRNLARDVGGDLWFEPVRDGGARFVLEMPRIRNAAAMAC